MRRSSSFRSLLFVSAALVCAFVLGYFFSPKAPAPLAPPFTASSLADAPALAARGPFKVGVTTLALREDDRPDLLGYNPVTGTVPRKQRTLEVVVWYPADLAPGQIEATDYVFATPQTPTIPPESLPASLSVPGRAAREAVPLRQAGTPYPLVVFSHGFRNWATGYSAMAENLASKGYVVASLEHKDADVSPLVPLELTFANTVASRAADQRLAIAGLSRQLGPQGRGAWAGLIDPERVALMGYSMGGFGALVTMGAGFDPAGKLYQQIPGKVLEPEAQGAPGLRAAIPQGVKALVAFAPWGGRPDLRVWSPESLAAIEVPSLFIAGDHDDVVGFEDGIAWIFDRMVRSDRHMLVYENARHNIAGDPAPPQLSHYFQFVERYEEPVWRRDRILAVNAHFITAFLDWRLKGDVSAQAYLNLPTPRANDAVWVSQQPADGRFAGPDIAESVGYWPGFQRRWAMGLHLRSVTTQPGVAP
jgi:predicted dienelactone hydrolase